MTGLDTDNDSIIEIATLVTDSELNVLAEGPVIAIHHALEVLQEMDDWNRNQHRTSGLWQRVLDSTVTMQEAEVRTLEFLAQWVAAVQDSDLPKMRKVAKTLLKHEEGLLNWFKHRISNGMAEGFNSVVQSLKSAARGFRNFANYRVRILFFCGKLDVMPKL